MLGVTFVLFLATASVDLSHAAQDSVRVEEAANGLGALLQLFRIAGGVIGMFGLVAGVVGGWLTFRAATIRAHVQTAEKTAQLREEQAKALEAQVQTQAEKMLAMESELGSLRARTDITTVLNIIEQMQKTADARWTRATGLLEDQNKCQLEAMNKNHDLLVTLSSNIARLTEKFTLVEEKVNHREEIFRQWEGRERRQTSEGRPPDGKERRRVS